MSLQDLLNQHEHGIRTNRSNDGRGFQSEMEATFAAYHRRGMARAVKVDPPTRVVGSYRAREVIFRANPFLDYVGVWKDNGGQMLCVEAKSTQRPRLPINRDSGLSAAQFKAMGEWKQMGAAVCLLWQCNTEVRLFTYDSLYAWQESAAAVSIEFSQGIPVPRGVGKVIWDFLPVLDEALRGPEAPEDFM